MSTQLNPFNASCRVIILEYGVLVSQSFYNHEMPVTAEDSAPPAAKFVQAVERFLSALDTSFKEQNDHPTRTNFPNFEVKANT